MQRSWKSEITLVNVDSLLFSVEAEHSNKLIPVTFVSNDYRNKMTVFLCIRIKIKSTVFSET